MHGAWVTQHQPQLGPGIKERMDMASKLTAEEVQAALQARTRIRCAYMFQRVNVHQYYTMCTMAL